MELYQLKYFSYVAKYENISKAAQDLRASQPSVSKAIQALEQELQVDLFRRDGRHIALTHEGKLLQARLLPILEELDSIPKEMCILGRRAREIIRLNVLSGGLLLPELIRTFKRDHPDVIFKISEKREKTDWDLCIRSTLPEISYNSAIKVMEERIFLAVHKDSPLAKKDVIHLEDLQDTEFIFLRAGSNLRNMADKRFQEAGFIPNITFECDTLYLLKNLVGAGLGVTFWPEYSWGKLEPAFTDVRLKKLDLREIYRSMYLIRSKDRTLSPVAEDFYDFVREWFEMLKNGREAT